MGVAAQPDGVRPSGGTARLPVAVDVPAAARAVRCRDGPGLPQRARSHGLARLRRRRDVLDQARGRGRQPPVHVAAAPGQAGGDGGRAIRRPPRPRGRQRLAARGVHRLRRVDGAPGRADRGVPGGAARAVDRRGRVPREVLRDPAGTPGPAAGAAARPADPARRHGTARDGAGRADRRRLGHREQHRPVEDRRGCQDSSGDRGGGRARAGPDRLPRRGARGQARSLGRAARAVVRKLRTDPGGCRMAGKLRCHRGLLRPELGSAGRRSGRGRGGRRAAGQ